MSATDPERDLAVRRRQVARRHHPDLGGDPEAFVAAMAELERPARAPASGPVEIVLSPRSRRRRRWEAARRALGEGVVRVRRLPRRLRPTPGHPESDPGRPPTTKDWT